MALIFDTANSTKWELIFSDSYEAPLIPGNTPLLEKYYPIEPITIPYTINSNLVAIFATSENAESHWKYAGQVIQKISLGITVGGVPTGVLSVKKFYLNQWSLLRYLDTYSSDYALQINIPYWLRDISLTLYGYSAPVVDSHEVLLNQLIDLVSS
jgi:hypothetical protein